MARAAAPGSGAAPTSLAGEFEQPYRPLGRPTLFTIPVLRYMKTYGLSHEQFAMVDGGGALILVGADRAGDFL